VVTLSVSIFCCGYFVRQYLILWLLWASVSSAVVTLSVSIFCCGYFERHYLLLWLLWASVSSAVVTLSVSIFCCGYFERQYLILWLLWASVSSAVVTLTESNDGLLWLRDLIFLPTTLHDVTFFKSLKSSWNWFLGWRTWNGIFWISEWLLAVWQDLVVF